ncbi:hypothetical protein KSD_90670 [Ktedonobacter sp. SOSP1-85]|nr:hypothetical protein KSD_90670 [Ktedonobacter sp. SOSP1-85]
MRPTTVGGIRKKSCRNVPNPGGGVRAKIGWDAPNPGGEYWEKKIYKPFF